MVTIVTGNIHNGKTTKMIHLFEANKGDGFVSIKNMKEDYVKGFDYLQLANKRTGPLATKHKIEPIRDILGPYYFNEEAMSYIELQLRELVEEGISPIYLDEIGQLELDGKGFYNIVKWVIEHMNQHLMFYISIRKPYVKQMIDLFQLKDVAIIDTSQE